MNYNKNDYNDIKKYPAPWNLKGYGYLLLYRFSKKEIQSDPFLSEKFKNSFLGGFGTVLIIDYKESNAGPYSELLFIPGKFRYGKKKKHTISKIYVSSRESIFNGRTNWAIPKEHANFKFNETTKNSETIAISSGNTDIAIVEIKKGFFRFPVNTAFLPFSLVQEQDGKAFYTKFSGSGIGKFAKIIDIKINSDMFPVIAEKKPLITIKIDPFKIHFPLSLIGKIK